jgi:hypothetical protein
VRVLRDSGIDYLLPTKLKDRWCFSRISFKYTVHFQMTRYENILKSKKVKVIPQQAEVAQGVSARLRSRIFLTFGTTRVAGRQPYTPAAFTPGEIPGTRFQGLSRPQGTWFLRG